MYNKYSNCPDLRSKMDTDSKDKIKKQKKSQISRKPGKTRTIIENIKQERNEKNTEEFECLNAVLNVIETLKKSYNLETKVGQNLGKNDTKDANLPTIRDCQVLLKDIKNQANTFNHELMDISAIKTELGEDFKMNLSSEALKSSKISSDPDINRLNRRFNCSFCHKSFTSRCYLSIHTKSHHKRPRKLSYSCNICNLKFTTKSIHKSHAKRKHSNVNRQMRLAI
ncbi:unnamed protein product [Chironomus riparius]|uniref:C2H2-type domain-containing protein n=1 Tax=Chironomus riparius TaxID=315576 RepID=A0A9N9WYR2_9DIPT|nr:unnamed protein product [Chironomus riparius]